jgi:amino-acid N-acetyltransferase
MFLLRVRGARPVTAVTITIGPARASDLDMVLALLAERHLPDAGLREHASTLIVARHEGRIVGSVALEHYSSGALLRSLAVDSGFEGQGLGSRLTKAALDHAASMDVQAIYLLTTTAESFFPRFGFSRVERGAVPEDVRASVEFATACPANAVAMVTRLG